MPTASITAVSRALGWNLVFLAGSQAEKFAGVFSLPGSDTLTYRHIIDEFRLCSDLATVVFNDTELREHLITLPGTVSYVVSATFFFFFFHLDISASSACDILGFVSLDFPYFPTLRVTAPSPIHLLPEQLDFLGPLLPSISTHGSHMVRCAFCSSEAP
ncbi:Uncharacterized protein HZ326_19151 [Fusarium oxysporum f. sp. albedinis]|nr:hypothetical protein HZ326_19719 [Fusarium oxysporum f. sp. albedinis]KAJ0137878.1 Uncharacterized protein HZ326_19151 [Fusarium oxysporum f. sp. albedinis]